MTTAYLNFRNCSTISPPTIFSTIFPTLVPSDEIFRSVLSICRSSSCLRRSASFICSAVSCICSAGFLYLPVGFLGHSVHLFLKPPVGFLKFFSHFLPLQVGLAEQFEDSLVSQWCLLFGHDFFLHLLKCSLVRPRINSIVHYSTCFSSGNQSNQEKASGFRQGGHAVSAARNSSPERKRRVIAPADRIPAIEPRAYAWGCYWELAYDGLAGYLQVAKNLSWRAKLPDYAGLLCGMIDQSGGISGKCVPRQGRCQGGP